MHSKSSFRVLGLAFFLTLFSNLALLAEPLGTVVKGSVEVVDAAGKVQVITAGQPIPAGSKVSTKTQTGAVIAPISGMEITLGDQATVELVTSPTGETSLKVISGNVSYSAAPGFSGSFSIQTSAGTVAVSSGAGSLMVAGNSVRVANTSGQATFSGAGRETLPVPTGAVLGVSGTSVTMTDLANKTVSVIGMNNQVTSSQPATSADLQLAQAAVNVASTPVSAAPASAGTPQIASPLTNGSANPANTSGSVNSPAQ